MKKLAIVLMAAVVGLMVSPVFADADDIAWVGKCLTDNKAEGKTLDVVFSYCKCMNSKMSSSETKSISEWEKTHKAEAEECGTKAGW